MINNDRQNENRICQFKMRSFNAVLKRNQLYRSYTSIMPIKMKSFYKIIFVERLFVLGRRLQIVSPDLGHSEIAGCTRDCRVSIYVTVLDIISRWRKHKILYTVTAGKVKVSLGYRLGKVYMAHTSIWARWCGGAGCITYWGSHVDAGIEYPWAGNACVV